MAPRIPATASTPAAPSRVSAALGSRDFTPGRSPGGIGHFLTGLGVSVLPAAGTAAASYAHNEDISRAIADATPVATATAGLGLGRMMARPAIRHQRQRQGDAAVQGRREAQGALQTHRDALGEIPQPHSDPSRYLTDPQRQQLERTDHQLDRREASAPPKPTRGGSGLPPKTAPQVSTPKGLQDRLDHLDQQIRAEEIKLEAVQKPAQNPLVRLFNAATSGISPEDRTKVLGALHKRVDPATQQLDTRGMNQKQARTLDQVWTHLQNSKVSLGDLQRGHFDPTKQENRPIDIGVNAAHASRLQDNLILLRERRDSLSQSMAQDTQERQARADAGAHERRAQAQQQRRRTHDAAQQRYDQHQAAIERLQAERDTLTQGAQTARQADVDASRERLEAVLSTEQRAELNQIDAALGEAPLAQREDLLAQREALLESARSIAADDPRLQRVEALDAEITRLQEAAADDGRLLRGLQLGLPALMGADLAWGGDDAFSAQHLPGVRQTRQGAQAMTDAVRQGRIKQPGFWNWKRIAGAGTAMGLLGLLAYSALTPQQRRRVDDEEDEEEKPARRRGRPPGTGRPRGRPRKVAA